MEDKEIKRKLRKVTDVDSTGEPIWKIEGSSQKSDRKKRPNDPATPNRNRRTARGDR
jgi:hypothetical protein